MMKMVCALLCLSLSHSFATVQKMETLCHIVQFEDDQNKTNMTCQCKSECGGTESPTSLPTDFNLEGFRLYSRMLSKIYGTYPKWVLNLADDFFIPFALRFCPCDGRFNQVANQKSPYHFRGSFNLMNYVANFICKLFYPSLITISEQVSLTYTSMLSLFECVTYLLCPIVFIVSLLNIATISLLIKKDVPAFSLQLFQLIAGLLSFILQNNFLRLLIKGFASVQFLCLQILFGESFICWSQMLSFGLLFDRFMCIYKPHAHRKYSSRKTTYIFIFSSLVMSFIFPLFFYCHCTTYGSESDGWVDFWNKPMLTVIAAAFFGLTTIYVIFFGWEIFLSLHLLIMLKKKANLINSQITVLQKNIYIILIGTMCTNVFELTAAIVNKLISGLMFYCYDHCPSTYQSILFLNVPTFTDHLLGFFVLAMPVLAFLVCIIFSHTYRKEFVSLFYRCNCSKNQVANLSVP